MVCVHTHEYCHTILIRELKNKKYLMCPYTQYMYVQEIQQKLVYTSNNVYDYFVNAWSYKIIQDKQTSGTCRYCWYTTVLAWIL